MFSSLLFILISEHCTGISNFFCSNSFFPVKATPTVWDETRHFKEKREREKERAVLSLITFGQICFWALGLLEQTMKGLSQTWSSGLSFGVEPISGPRCGGRAAEECLATSARGRCDKLRVRKLSFGGGEAGSRRGPTCEFAARFTQRRVISLSVRCAGGK